MKAMKDRLPALDGLRGLAALAVALSHSGFSPLALTTLPIILTAYNTLAVGPNSVQILFVLSGFLMAFLYPTMPGAASFIKKRYARILPIYGTIVIFLWLTSLSQKVFQWYLQIPLLLLLALAIHFGWRFLSRANKWLSAGKVIFYSFVVLQSILLFTNLFITPHFITADLLQLPTLPKQILVLLSNLTLTTPFVQDVNRLSGVFWSLAPEMLFYILYPFLVSPLIQLSKKWGYIVSIIIVLAATKILFDLDAAVVTIGSLQSMSIARASGFVAGVTIGTMYQTKGTLWKSLEKFLKQPFVALLALALFIGIQWGDGAIRDGQSIAFMNMYYLISSWIIAFLILTAIIPRTVTYKIFSNKVLTFLGLISYSMYLIHTQVWEWMKFIMLPFNSVMHATGIQDLFYVMLGILVTVGLSALLFYVVEYLYFTSKKKVIETTLATESEKVKREYQSYSPQRVAITAVITIMVLGIVYSGVYSPTFLLTRHTVPFRKEQSLLQKSVSIPFTATNNNLSSAIFDLRYAKSAGQTIATRKNPAILQFTLLDTSSHVLFTSTHEAYIVEGQSRFPFGMPTISDSKNKQYIAKLSLQNGHTDDQIFVENAPTGFTTIYRTNKTDILHNPIRFIANKFIYVFTNIDLLFAVIFVLFVTAFLPSITYINKRTKISRTIHVFRSQYKLRGIFIRE